MSRATLLLLLAGGCAQAPTHELEIAASRVELARGEDAALFAPALFREAESSLAEAKRLLSAEGDYLGAVQAAAHSTLRANEAFLLSSTARTAVVQKLDRLLTELESLLEIAAARGASETASQELAQLRLRYEGVRRLREERDLFEALEAGTALKPELMAFEARFRGN
jgi:hypothetical protein